MGKDMKMDLETKNGVSGSKLRREGVGQNEEEKPSFKEVLAKHSRLSQIDLVD